VLILAGSPTGDAGTTRFARIKAAAPARRNSNLYLIVGCLLLVVEAAYFWFNIDVFNSSTYR